MKLSPIKALNCQSVNRLLMCQVLEEEMSTPAPLKQVSMSSEEENAVRYASGFVPMRLMKKYKKINNIKAAQFVIAYHIWHYQVHMKMKSQVIMNTRKLG